MTALRDCVAKLAKEYGPLGVPPKDAFALIVWQNAGEAIDNERRAAVFRVLSKRIGLAPQSLLDAPRDQLLRIARAGGPQARQRVERWRRIAQLALELAPGGLDEALRALAVGKARTLLKKFPGITDPVADKIVLFCGLAPLPAFDSGGLRVLVRLGFIERERSYGAMYRSAVGLTLAEGKLDRDWLILAHEALGAHGALLCRRAEPECVECALKRRCPSAG